VIDIWIGGTRASCNTHWGHPLPALPRLEPRRAVHPVDVLQGEVGRLVQEEEDEDRAEEVASSEDVSVAEADRIGDVRREEGNEEVLPLVQAHMVPLLPLTQIQLDATARDACFCLVLVANVSPVRIHTPGAHVEA